MIPGVDPLTLEDLICFGTETQGTQMAQQTFTDTCGGVDFDALANSTVSWHGQNNIVFAREKTSRTLVGHG